MTQSRYPALCYNRRLCICEGGVAEVELCICERDMAGEVEHALCCHGDVNKCICQFNNVEFICFTVYSWDCQIVLHKNSKLENHTQIILQ